MRLQSYFVTAIIIGFGWGTGYCKTPMEYKAAWKSTELIHVPPAIIGTSDLDGNGMKEVYLTDFSIDTQRTRGNKAEDYHFLLFEWDGKRLKEKWKKKWTAPVEVRHQYYYFFNFLRWINVWEVGVENYTY